MPFAKLYPELEGYNTELKYSIFFLFLTCYAGKQESFVVHVLKSASPTTTFPDCGDVIIKGGQV